MQNDQSKNGQPVSVGSTGCSALWLIEILWTDSLENEIDSARGYGPEGYALTESDADALIAQAGLYTGNCWAISEPTPLRRKKRIELLSPNDRDEARRGTPMTTRNKTHSGSTAQRAVASGPWLASDLFVSGGRNPNWEACCYTCAHQTQSKERPGWGWCSIRNNASVSPHGGCGKHLLR